MHVPAHSQGCTYPALRRLRLGAAPVADGDVPMRSAEEEDGDASSPGGVAASGDGAGLGVADTVRTLLGLVNLPPPPPGMPVAALRHQPLMRPRL